MIQLTTDDADELRVPSGSTLVHIGFPKTGSSALQYSASRMRDRLLSEGVCYPGEGRFHFREFISLVKAYPEAGGSGPEAGGSGPKPVGWTRMVKELTSSTAPRGFISSEAGSQASPAAIARVKSDLGPHAHIVVTLRGLAERLIAAWQQRVREGSETWDFDEWMHMMLGDQPAVGMNPVFIERNLDPIGVIQRWARVFGDDHVTVVMVDKRTPDLLYDSFDAMLGLPQGTLKSGIPNDITRLNRGMNQTEIEFIRQIRKVFQEAGVPRIRLKHVLARGGVSRARVLRHPDPDEGRLLMPQWAYDRVVPIAAGQRAKLEASGMRVVGDPAVIENPVGTRTTPYPQLDSVPMDLAVHMVVGTAAKGAGLHHLLKKELSDGEWQRLVASARGGAASDPDDDDDDD